MKYNKILQKKICCVGACVEMVLNRHSIKNSGQESIAYNLGLIVPVEEKDNYKRCRFGNKPTSGYGTQIQEDKYSINNFFKKHNIPLISSYHYIIDFNQAKKFLLENSNKDILIIMHCGTLYSSPTEDWGHMVLFESINNSKLTILDPCLERDYEIVDLENLLKAIEYHGKDKGAGFYLINKI